MMYRTIFLTFLISVCAIFQAQAACYTSQQAEAEQAIRIHSELMIIALTCQHRTPKGQPNLYVQYRNFTSAHSRLLSNYESALIQYYKANRAKDPESDFNTLRTNFANKISNDAARMRPDKFCASFLDRVPRAARMTDADFRKWASLKFSGHPVSKPLCTSARK